MHPTVTLQKVCRPPKWVLHHKSVLIVVGITVEDLKVLQMLEDDNSETKFEHDENSVHSAAMP